VTLFYASNPRTSPLNAFNLQPPFEVSMKVFTKNSQINRSFGIRYDDLNTKSFTYDCQRLPLAAESKNGSAANMILGGKWLTSALFAGV
jgi:hypothetical protein